MQFTTQQFCDHSEGSLAEQKYRNYHLKIILMELREHSRHFLSNC